MCALAFNQSQKGHTINVCVCVCVCVYVCETAGVALVSVHVISRLPAFNQTLTRRLHDQSDALTALPNEKWQLCYLEDVVG